MSTPFHLMVPERIVAEMIRHARSELPHECCGLLAGRMLEWSPSNGAPELPPRARVERAFPLTNEAASPVEFLSEPRSMLAAMRELRRHDWEVLAVYHSHPTTDPIPSRRDLERNYSSQVVNFIISLKTGVPAIRGWWLSEQTFHEAQWDSLPDSIAAYP